MDGWKEIHKQHKRRRGEREKGAVLGMETRREVCWLKAESKDRKGEKKGR